MPSSQMQRRYRNKTKRRTECLGERSSEALHWDFAGLLSYVSCGPKFTPVSWGRMLRNFWSLIIGSGSPEEFCLNWNSSFMPQFKLSNTADSAFPNHQKLTVPVSIVFRWGQGCGGGVVRGNTCFFVGRVEMRRSNLSRTIFPGNFMWPWVLTICPHQTKNEKHTFIFFQNVSIGLCKESTQCIYRW